ncbi:MAG: NAD(P)-binding domain-containing protein, partial [Lewinella sp.]
PHAYIGQEVLVIGAANSACDAALECYRKGARVTMAVRGDRINERVKYWIRPDIENRIKEGSIKAYFNTTPELIREQEVVLNTPGGQLTVPNDFVLAMTGYIPNEDLFERIGLGLADDHTCQPLFNPDTLETTLPGVYMAGVACAGRQTSKLFIENTRDHGDIIISGITARQQPA